MWVKVKVTYSGVKMLDTIIAEANFFSIWFFFTNIHDSQVKRGRGNLSLSLLIGVKLFWAKNLWGGYAKWEYK